MHGIRKVHLAFHKECGRFDFPGDTQHGPHIQLVFLNIQAVHSGVLILQNILSVHKSVKGLTCECSILCTGGGGGAHKYSPGGGFDFGVWRLCSNQLN